MKTDGTVEIDTGSDYSVLNEDWTFILRATSSISTADPDNNLDYQFGLSLLDGCLLDVLSSPSTIDNLIYYIDDTGLYTISTPTYT